MMSKMKTIKRQIKLISVWGLLAASLACTPRSFEKTNAAAPASPTTVEEKLSDFQNELKKMRTADLQYVFVFRRKDGAAFDSDDKKYLKATLPTSNRIVLTDDDKAVIVGSNFKFPPENVEILQARFNIDYFSAGN